MPMKTTVYEDGTTFSYIMRERRARIESLIIKIKHREVYKKLLCSLWGRGFYAGVAGASITTPMVSRIRRGCFDNSYSDFDSEFIMDFRFRFRTAGIEKRIWGEEQAVKNLETGPNRARLPPRYEGGKTRVL